MLPRQLLPSAICSPGPNQVLIKTKTHSLSHPHTHLHPHPHLRPSPSLRLAPTPSSIRRASVVGEQVSLGSKCPRSISRVTALFMCSVKKEMIAIHFDLIMYFRILFCELVY